MAKIMAERHEESWPSKASKTGRAHARKKRWPTKDRGKKGKTPKSKKWLKKKMLVKISGYHIDLPVERRHSRLIHAMISRGGGRAGTRSVFRELVALHNVNPDAHAKAVFKEDANWVGKKYGFHLA